MPPERCTHHHDRYSQRRELPSRHLQHSRLTDHTAILFGQGACRHSRCTIAIIACRDLFHADNNYRGSKNYKAVPPAAVAYTLRSYTEKSLSRSRGSFKPSRLSLQTDAKSYPIDLPCVSRRKRPVPGQMRGLAANKGKDTSMQSVQCVLF